MLQTHMYSLLLINLSRVQTTNSFLSLITLKWPKEKKMRRAGDVARHGGAGLGEAGPWIGLGDWVAILDPATKA